MSLKRTRVQQRHPAWSVSGAGGGAAMFDQHHRRFYTFCGCHVRACAGVIGLMELIALAASVIGTGVTYLTLDHPESGLLSSPHVSLIGAGAAFVVGVLVIGQMFYGLAKEKSAFLIPHLISQLVAIIGLLAAIVVFVYVALVAADAGVRAKTETPPIRHQGWAKPGRVFVYSVAIIGLCSLACALEIYFLVIVYRAYAYFYAKREAHSKCAPSIQLVTTSTSFPGQDTITSRAWMDS